MVLISIVMAKNTSLKAQLVTNMEYSHFLRQKQLINVFVCKNVYFYREDISVNIKEEKS